MLGLVWFASLLETDQLTNARLYAPRKTNRDDVIQNVWIHNNDSGALVHPGSKTRALPESTSEKHV